MPRSLHGSLYEREIAAISGRYPSYPKLYSDRQLIAELDIVNELDGHSGCVNALSWSRSGSLLASGSDDQHLNIHTYQPSSNRQFQLTATVATGHTQNIFSVKFMPHSGDNTVITAAGDAEVRVFDLEYSGQHTGASSSSSRAAAGRQRRREHVFNNVRYLSDGNTNCRVYRSHGDRVKRIVTESSPHLFLTCSEDGEVRQWDLRQPSSAYPAPRGNGWDTSVPPPLISYRRYGLDLNTISCSASQPHYIVLGGAHLHAFLHDRRMIGRDQLKESGASFSPSFSPSPGDGELLSKATQCVKKFAPKGQPRMKRGSNGHITACKISDARPDEMVVSWSGDNIYSFDLVRDTPPESQGLNRAAKRKNFKNQDRKRKRQVDSIETSVALEAPDTSRLRVISAAEAALRIQYLNGQTEEIPIPNLLPPNDSSLTSGQRGAKRIANAVHRIGEALLDPVVPDSSRVAKFISAFNTADEILTHIDQVIREWTYPLNPNPSQAGVQQSLRRGREDCRRFVQAAGTLARVLTVTADSSLSLRMTTGQHLFSSVQVRRSNEFEPNPAGLFGYIFLKAILLWLDSGIGQLIEGFCRPVDVPGSSRKATGLPIPESEASTEAIDEYLVPYLMSLAGDESLTDLDANRFLTEENRNLFGSERDAVYAFATAVKIPFADLSSEGSSSVESEDPMPQDRQDAREFWAGKVGRALLLKARSAVTFHYANHVFGGSTALVSPPEEEQEAPTLSTGPDVAQHHLDDEEKHESGEQLVGEAGANENANNEFHEEIDDDYDDDSDDIDGGGDDDSETDSTTSASSSELDDEAGVFNSGPPRPERYLFRQRSRTKVETHVSCSAPTRTYKGHCNTKTVKDVNYFGPDDDYVVSGSDDGNFFIWDRKTSKLVNILEGDGEVVNVIQGHPYETMLAVSGIDHTIKIFSPDARARDVARLGQGIFAHDASNFSSLAWPRRVDHRVTRRNEQPATTDTVVAAVAAEIAGGVERNSTVDTDEDQSHVAANGLRSRRRFADRDRIIRQNQEELAGRNTESYISFQPPFQLPSAQILQMLFGQLGNLHSFNY